jgi:hypothetical protein
MKTFREFIVETTIQDLRSRANAARQRGDMATFIELQKQASELGAGTQAKIAAVTGDKDKKPERENTYISGKPSKPKDTRGSTGSLPNIPSSAGEGEDTSTGGRYGDRRSGRSGGVSGQSRNNATARNLGHLGSKS